MAPAKAAARPRRPRTPPPPAILTAASRPGAGGDAALPVCSACVEWRLAPGGVPTEGSCGPAAAHHAGQPHALPTVEAVEKPDPALRSFWARLPPARRRSLLSVSRRELFERVRGSYCSRCYRLFQFRYEELCKEAHDCAACRACYGGLRVAEDGSVTLEDASFAPEGRGPFTAFAAGAARKRERDLEFQATDVCGSGWQRRPGVIACGLHTSAVDVADIVKFFKALPPDHAAGLLSYPEEDFTAEVDNIVRYQLKASKDCRPAVAKRIKALRASSAAAAAVAAAAGPKASPPAAAAAPAGGAAATAAPVPAPPAQAPAAPATAPGISGAEWQVLAMAGLEPPPGTSAPGPGGGPMRLYLAPGAWLVVSDGTARVELAAVPSDASDEAAAAATAAAAAAAGPSGLPKTLPNAAAALKALSLITALPSVKAAAAAAAANGVGNCVGGAAPEAAADGMCTEKARAALVMATDAALARVPTDSNWDASPTRHADTPQQADQLLADCALMVIRGQIETAYREQVAGHNALLLFVSLAAGIMEDRLRAALGDERLRAGDEELLRLFDPQPHCGSPTEGAAGAGGGKKGAAAAARRAVAAGKQAAETPALETKEEAAGSGSDESESENNESAGEEREEEPSGEQEGGPGPEADGGLTEATAAAAAEAAATGPQQQRRQRKEDEEGEGGGWEPAVAMPARRRDSQERADLLAAAKAAAAAAAAIKGVARRPARAVSPGPSRAASGRLAVGPRIAPAPRVTKPAAPRASRATRGAAAARQVPAAAAAGPGGPQVRQPPPVKTRAAGAAAAPPGGGIKILFCAMRHSTSPGGTAAAEDAIGPTGSSTPCSRDPPAWADSSSCCSSSMAGTPRAAGLEGPADGGGAASGMSRMANAAVAAAAAAAAGLRVPRLPSSGSVDNTPSRRSGSSGGTSGFDNSAGAGEGPEQLLCGFSGEEEACDGETAATAATATPVGFFPVPEAPPVETRLGASDPETRPPACRPPPAMAAAGWAPTPAPLAAGEGLLVAEAPAAGAAERGLLHGLAQAAAAAAAEQPAAVPAGAPHGCAWMLQCRSVFSPAVRHAFQQDAAASPDPPSVPKVETPGEGTPATVPHGLPVAAGVEPLFAGTPHAAAAVQPPPQLPRLVMLQPPHNAVFASKTRDAEALTAALLSEPAAAAAVAVTADDPPPVLALPTGADAAADDDDTSLGVPATGLETFAVAVARAWNGKGEGAGAGDDPGGKPAGRKVQKEDLFGALDLLNSYKAWGFAIPSKSTAAPAVDSPIVAPAPPPPPPPPPVRTVPPPRPPPGGPPPPPPYGGFVPQAHQQQHTQQPCNTAAAASAGQHHAPYLLHQLQQQAALAAAVMVQAQTTPLPGSPSVAAAVAAAGQNQQGCWPAQYVQPQPQQQQQQYLHLQQAAVVHQAMRAQQQLQQQQQWFGSPGGAGAAGWCPPNGMQQPVQQPHWGNVVAANVQQQHHQQQQQQMPFGHVHATPPTRFNMGGGTPHGGTPRWAGYADSPQQAACFFGPHGGSRMQ